MKKILFLSFALLFVGVAAEAQTKSTVKKEVIKKKSTKGKILTAVQSEKTKAAVKKAQQDKRKEGE